MLRTVEDRAKLVAVRAHEKGLELVVAVEPDVPKALRGDDVSKPISLEAVRRVLSQWLREQPDA